MNYINPKRLFIVILIFSVALSCLAAYADSSKQDIASAVFRLHVIANSNSDADQALKLKVRDRIIKETTTLFSNAKTASEAEKIAKENAFYLKKICRSEIAANGSNQSVRLETGEYAFPQKNYGSITLPQGSYRALRVVIGEGGGKNWWCVMFPPLCFARGTVRLSEKSESYLKCRLSPAEYNLIKSGKTAETPEVRLKIAEIFKKLIN